VRPLRFGVLAALLVIAAQPASAATGQAMATGLQYFPATVGIHKGDKLVLGNFDAASVPSAGHTITETTRASRPRFDSPPIRFGETGEINGVSSVPVGTYQFHCRVHPGMRGTLVVKPPPPPEPPTPR